MSRLQRADDSVRMPSRSVAMNGLVRTYPAVIVSANPRSWAITPRPEGVNFGYTGGRFGALGMRTSQEQKEVFMSTFAKLTIAIAVFVATGCATATPQSPTVNVTGDWVGEWVCNKATDGAGVVMRWPSSRPGP